MPNVRKLTAGRGTVLQCGRWLLEQEAGQFPSLQLAAAADENDALTLPLRCLLIGPSVADAAVLRRLALDLAKLAGQVDGQGDAPGAQLPQDMAAG